MVNKCLECGQESVGTRGTRHAEKHRARNKKSREKNIGTYMEREARERQRIREDERLRARDYAYKRKHRLMREYGITPEQYDILLEAQDGKCAICGLSAPLVVDHDHETGRVRGLLCQLCNSGLGMFKDSTDALRRALRYLE